MVLLVSKPLFARLRPLKAFFFFQAEDGIRDLYVTGVQTCALPILALAQLDAAELMCLKAAWLFDTGRPCGREANAAKLLAAEAGFQACDAALQTFGGFGYAKEFYVERLWREIRLYKIAPISQQMALNYLSEHVLGLPRSY